jgi:hypothetical protein
LVHTVFIELSTAHLLKNNSIFYLLWPTLWLGHIVAPSTVSLLLYLHLFLAPFSCSFSLSLLYDIHPGVRTIFVFTLSPVRHPSRCSYYLCVHSLSPVRHPSRCSYYLCVHSLSLLYDIHLGVRTIFVFTLSLSCTTSIQVFVLSLCSLSLSCTASVQVFVLSLCSLSLSPVRSRYGWVVKLFDTYPQGTVFEPRHYQTYNDPGQVTNGCLSRITRPIAYWLRGWHTRNGPCDYCMWLVSMYGELKWLSERTLSQAGLLSRAAASNSYRKKYRASRNYLRIAPYTAR